MKKKRNKDMLLGNSDIKTDESEKTSRSFDDMDIVLTTSIETSASTLYDSNDLQSQLESHERVVRLLFKRSNISTKTIKNIIIDEFYPIFRYR